MMFPYILKCMVRFVLLVNAVWETRLSQKCVRSGCIFLYIGVYFIKICGIGRSFERLYTVLALHCCRLAKGLVLQAQVSYVHKGLQQ